MSHSNFTIIPFIYRLVKAKVRNILLLFFNKLRYAVLTWGFNIVTILGYLVSKADNTKSRVISDFSR